MTRCRATEETNRHLNKMVDQDMRREHWEDTIREILGEVPDDLLDKFWQEDMTAYAAADLIEEEMGNED
jgi:hypothetical protein